MLELKCNIFRKLKNFEVGQLHFQKIVIFDNNVKKVKNRAFLQFLVRGCMKVKLPNFKNFLFFWKYISSPLTYIFNLARRQIQKKLCRPFKFSRFLAPFCLFLPKIRFFTIKMVKNSIFRQHPTPSNYARLKP